MLNGIATAEWDRCPVHCVCPQPEVVHCNEIQIRDDDHPGKYKQLDHIPDDIPPGKGLFMRFYRGLVINI